MTALSRWIVAASVLCAAGCSQSGGSTVADRAGDTPAAVLAAPGRIEGQSDVVEVGAAMDGLLEAVLVREGQTVRAGETIARLACDDLQADIGATKAAAEAARQSRTRLLRGSRDEERRAAAAETAAARAGLGQAQDEHDRLMKLVTRGAEAPAELDRATRQLDAARATEAAAVARETLVNAGPLPEEVQRADAEVAAADRRAATTEARFQKCFVRSPIDGTVLKRHREAGESISMFVPRPIVTIANVSTRHVRAEVDERDVGRVREGQRVRVTLDAFPGRAFSGTVQRIGSVMGRKTIRAGDPAEKADRDVLEVLVDVDRPDPNLVIGLRVTVSFLDTP